MPNSLATPHGPRASTCGYCSPAGERTEEESSYKTASLSAYRLTCDVYQTMIDRGWRRSGKYCYKPDLKRSCCPQYTIRLDARAFKASRRQRKLVNRWNRFVLSGMDTEHMDDQPSTSTAPKEKKKPGKVPEFSLCEAMHASETGFAGSSGAAPFHSFETTLEPSTYTKEKYALFERYQRNVHHDEDSTPSGFKRFLVDSPLLDAPIPYTSTPATHLPRTYGSYHQMYRLDGTLIAMGVIDVLPSCVSSVYFMYDHEKWDKFSLGKLSALREVSLTREMHEAGAPGMEFLYMGFYIHSCPKMRYKGEYAPSYLADPETYTWHPLPRCIPLLDKHRYACFERPERSLDDIPGSADLPSESLSPPPPPPNGLDLDLELELEDVQAVSEVRDATLWIAPVATTPYWHDADLREGIVACVRGLGADAAREMVFLF